MSQLCEWGATVWIKRLDAGKLEPRAEQAHFVGYDDKSKGFQIYWPNKRKVSIEWDMYFDKDQALQPDEASIEGVEDVLTNSDTSQSQKSSDESPDAPNKPGRPSKTVDNGPAPANVDN